MTYSGPSWLKMVVMSFKRNLSIDRTVTASLLEKVPHDRLNNKNWLGHKGGAAYVDAMLLIGATMEQLEEGPRGAIEQHLRHLRVEHGLEVVCEGGVYRLRMS